MDAEHSSRFDLTQAIAALARTPSVFRTLLQGVPEWWTNANEGPDTFSAFDNLGHLVHGERTDWIPRARIILEHGRSRPFEPFDRFAQAHESRGKTLGDLLNELERLRADNLEVLRNWRLGARELTLEGEHPALGRVTLAQLLATWVVHDLGHLAQTSRVLAKQYRDEVGPWRAYLPVLDR
jgi:hypothetical protein